MQHALTNDTSLGKVMRYADAGYDEAIDEAEKKQVRPGWGSRASAAIGR